MAPEAPYLAELKATKRPILRQHCLQRASNELPPAALTRLYLHLRAIGGPALCKLAPEYRFMTAAPQRRAAKKPPLKNQQDFGENLHLITPDLPAADKTLFILFGGDDGQFFIPFAALLALLPDIPKDVVAIRAGVQNFYKGGVAGLGCDAYEVAKALREKFKTGDFDRVVVMGISVGGIFSLRVADCLAAQTGLSFACIFPNEGFRLTDTLNTGATAFDPLCACRPSQAGRLINVLATKNEFDLLFSKRLKKQRPALLEFHMVNSSQHNVLQTMLKSGYAKVFFRMAIAPNGKAIWLVSKTSRFYGLYIVRSIRRLFGVQKLRKWY